jgi:hypothetical protein
MKSKLIPLAVALFAIGGTSGALAHESGVTANAMSLHYLEHAGDGSAQYTGKPYAQSDAMDTDWIFAESPAPRGAAGPIGEQDFTPDPSTSGDGMSLHWISDE